MFGNVETMSVHKGQLIAFMNLSDRKDKAFNNLLDTHERSLIRISKIKFIKEGLKDPDYKARLIAASIILELKDRELSGAITQALEIIEDLTSAISDISLYRNEGYKEMLNLMSEEVPKL